MKKTMKHTKKLMCTILTAVMVITLSGGIAPRRINSVEAASKNVRVKNLKKGSTFTYNNLKYKVTSTKNNSRKVTCTGVKSNQKKAYTIPNTIKVNNKSFKVTAVAKSAFKSKKIKSITIGSNVTSIGKDAFLSCKNLTKVTIKSTKINSINKTAFKNTNITLVIPAKKAAAYSGMLNSLDMGNGTITVTYPGNSDNNNKTDTNNDDDKNNKKKCSHKWEEVSHPAEGHYETKTTQGRWISVSAKAIHFWGEDGKAWTEDDADYIYPFRYEKQTGGGYKCILLDNGWETIKPWDVLAWEFTGNYTGDLSHERIAQKNTTVFANKIVRDEYGIIDLAETFPTSPFGGYTTCTVIIGYKWIAGETTKTWVVDKAAYKETVCTKCGAKK